MIAPLPSPPAPVLGAPATSADPFDAGPYTRLQAALRLTPLAATRSAARRAAVAAAVAWVPLLLLAAAQGLALRPSPRESFLLDVSAHARYLVAIPLLFLAEPWCLPRLATIARHFASAGMIGEGDRMRYESLIAATRRLLDQRGVEVALVLIAYLGTASLGGIVYPQQTSTWIAPAGWAHARSLAGWWRALVSQPLFFVLVAAWFWRVGVWSRFLWGVARLELRLVPAHPDLAAGLSFVATSIRAFAPVALALSAALAGGVALALLQDGRELREFRSLVVAMVLVVVALFAGPMLCFVEPLRRARIRGIFAYGALAGSLGRRFEERWVQRDQAVELDALAQPDFSATTDLYSIAANVRQLRVVPFGLWDLTPLVLSTLLPFVPVVLLVVPVEQFVQLAARLLR